MYIIKKDPYKTKIWKRNISLELEKLGKFDWLLKERGLLSIHLLLGWIFLYHVSLSYLASSGVSHIKSALENVAVLIVLIYVKIKGSLLYYIVSST